MSIGSTTIDSQGYPMGIGYGGAGALGGIGGLGLVGLIGLNSFLGNGFGLNGAGAAGVAAATVPGTTVMEQNVSELRKDVAGVNTTVEALGNELQAAFATQNLSQAGEFRNLDNRLCESEKTALQAAYAASLQGFQNTQAIQNQVTAFQVANDQQFCSIKSLINSDGDATRALINQIETQNLRDQLSAERRSRDAREIEINVTQTNQQTQNQLQAQLQSQTNYFASALNALGDQINRNTNSLVNIGSGIVASPQTATSTNNRVNS